MVCSNLYIIPLSPVQVLCKRGWHLLFTSHSDFCKNAQKPHKNGTMIFCCSFKITTKNISVNHKIILKQTVHNPQLLLEEPNNLDIRLIYQISILILYMINYSFPQGKLTISLISSLLSFN